MAPRLWIRLIGAISVLASPLFACAPFVPDDWAFGGAFGPWQGGYAAETGALVGPPQLGKYVTTAAVAFRDGPSSEIRLLAVLPPGTVVMTDGRELGGWWGVDYGNSAGWIFGSYLKPE